MGLSDFAGKPIFCACICSRSALQLHHVLGKEADMNLITFTTLCVFDAWIWLHNLHIILGA